MEPRPNLSSRQAEILILIAGGRTRTEIASHLGISAKTVDTHRLTALRKTGARNNVELALWAIRARLINPLEDHGQ